MNLGRLAYAVSLAAGAACAQDTSGFEIRGILGEAGLNTGVPGARITVYQFSSNSERSVFTTGTTDSQGKFEFHPSRPGNYYVEAGKPGYSSTHTDAATKESLAAALKGTTVAPPETTGSLASVSREHPREFVRLVLMRPPELTGRVVDDNEKPLAGMLVEVLGSGPATQQSVPLNVRANTRTTSDGTFDIRSLPPGQYVVRVSALSPGTGKPVTSFTSEDLDVVDEGLETFYWPGVRDASAAGNVTLVSGAPSDLGNIRIHRGDLYRVKVSVGGCKDGESLRVSLVPTGGPTLRSDGTLQQAIGASVSPLTECADFLIRNLHPGSYELAVQGADGWALVPVEVTDKNQSMKIALARDADIVGTVVGAYDGIKLPALDKVLVTLWAFGSSPFGYERMITTAKIAGNGFSFKDVRWPRHSVVVAGLAAGYYVREIRMDGVAAPGGLITTSSLGRMEIVIDDQPSTLSGKVSDGDQPAEKPTIFVARWPPVPSTAGGIMGVGDSDGRFQVTGLAPGEYRVLALPHGPVPDGASDWDITPQQWDHAEHVTLERGQPTEITLKLSDPIAGN